MFLCFVIFLILGFILGLFYYRYVHHLELQNLERDKAFFNSFIGKG